MLLKRMPKETGATLPPRASSFPNAIGDFCDSKTANPGEVLIALFSGSIVFGRIGFCRRRVESQCCLPTGSRI